MTYSESTLPANQELAGDFATVEAIQSEAFRLVNRKLSIIHAQLALPGHEDYNQKLFPWSIKEHPEARLYATRLWEYPWAISKAKLEPNMICGDVGCGMTAFTPYLVREEKCIVTGFDPDVVETGFPKGEFGVNPIWLEDSRIRFKACGMDALDAEDNTFDRLFCLSVIEHVPADVAIRGMQEMARVLKPGGLAIITMDLCVSEDVPSIDPLSLIWESGLLPAGELNLAWPVHRLGHGFKRGLSADVYGLVLRKDATVVDETYGGPTPVKTGKMLERWQIPAVRSPKPRDPVPLGFSVRLRLVSTLLRRGYDAMLDRYARIYSGKEK